LYKYRKNNPVILSIVHGESACKGFTKKKLNFSFFYREWFEKSHKYKKNPKICQFSRF